MPRSPGRNSHAWEKLKDRYLGRPRRPDVICWLCGKPGADSLDHLTPLHDGGAPVSASNVKPSHVSCNSSRGNRTRRTRHSRQW